MNTELHWPIETSTMVHSAGGWQETAFSEPESSRSATAEETGNDLDFIRRSDGIENKEREWDP